MKYYRALSKYDIIFKMHNRVMYRKCNIRYNIKYINISNHLLPWCDLKKGHTRCSVPVSMMIPKC